MKPNQWAQDPAREERMRQWAWMDWDSATNHPSRFWWLRRAGLLAEFDCLANLSATQVRAQLDPDQTRRLEVVLRAFGIEEGFQLPLSDAHLERHPRLKQQWTEWLNTTRGATA